MNKTFLPIKDEKTKIWFLLDADKHRLGRLSTFASMLLQGKTLTNFTPGADSKVGVIIINAEKIELTGNKLNDKFYYSHTGKPGELKTRSAAYLLKEYPHRLLELSIKRMLPDGFAKANLAKRLKVYKGNTHPHTAQKPVLVNPPIKQ